MLIFFLFCIMLGVVITFLLTCSYAACPDVKFFCPDGKIAVLNTTWSWKNWQCEFMDDMGKLLDDRKSKNIFAYTTEF